MILFNTRLIGKKLIIIFITFVMSLTSFAKTEGEDDLIPWPLPAPTALAMPLTEKELFTHIEDLVSKKGCSANCSFDNSKYILNCHITCNTLKTIEGFDLEKEKLLK